MKLSEKEKSLLFWASFASLAAAGVGFVLRVMVMGKWGPEYAITGTEVGEIFGLSLWPIAVTMILFSLIVDKVGYKISMYLACLLQALSVILTVTATDAATLKWACFFGGLGHGIIEAVINPLCAAMYTSSKSKMLNILHASWPAGIVAGGIVYLMAGPSIETWNNAFWIMMLPIVGYGIAFATIKEFPVDERVSANVSNRDMLREFGGLGAFLAITFVVYELTKQICGLAGDSTSWIATHLLSFSSIIGAIGGIAFGASVGSKGKWMFFVLCIIMIPLAATELGTDAWIKELMTPVMGEDNAGWAIVASAGIMMILRFFAGVPLKFMSPPTLLLVSSLFSMIGLYVLSGATGTMVFIAFTLYAVGQTFYWPTILGFVSERFPKGGAMTLNTVSAMGLLTIGIFGAPFLGAIKTSYDAKTVTEFTQNIKDVDGTKYVKPAKFFFVEHDSVVPSEVLKDKVLTEEQKVQLSTTLGKSGRQTLKAAALMPLAMAVAFMLIIFWFKAKGGYKAIELAKNKA